MPSDIFIKTGSSTWSKLTNLFIKTGSSTWSAATGIWAYLQADWVKVWPLSGIFSTRKPWIAASSSDTYSNRITTGPLRIGTSYIGNNAQWNPNGWTIASYSYKWNYYDSSGTELGTIRSGTGSGWTSTSGQDTLPTSVWTATNSSNVDNQYIGFYVDANASNSSYTGSDVSVKIKVVRQVPLNLTTSLSSYAPTVGTQITYSSSWDISQARKIDTSRTTAYWYKNSTNSTSGGTFIGSGYSYTPQASDLGQYIYVVETAYNSGTDYDYGSTTGVTATAITTSTVAQSLSAPTSTSISSVSRLDNTTTRVVVSSSGGSGPYYQLYWISSSTAPVTANYDAASTTSTVTEDFGFAHNTTYYFYIRSSSVNLGNTTTNGTATNGTYSAYGPSTGAASYTFQQPSGSVSVSPSTGTAGSTQFSASASISSAPSAQISYQWQYFEGGAIGWAAISAATSSTYTPPSNYVSLYGSGLRCQVTANNGVGNTLTTASSQITVSAPVVAPTNATQPTLSPTTLAVGTQLSAGIGTWNNSPTNYDIRIYRGTAGVITSETLVASRSGTSTANLTYTITQADYDSGQRYFRTYVDASNSGGSSGLIAGQERGPIAAPTTYTVSWNANGGSVSPSSNSGTSGTSVTAPTPTRSGYTFLYWRDTLSAFSYLYQVSAGGSWTIGTGGTTNITFYAWWQAAGGTAPATPTGVSLSGSGLVSWTASSGATSYNIIFYTAQNGSGLNANGPYSVTGITSTSYQLTSPYASPNNWARVQVAAVNSNGTSTYSAWVPSSTTYT